MNHRQFLKTAGLIAAGPLIFRRNLFGADAPSKKINIGMIGVGRQAMDSNLLPFLLSDDRQVLAVCATRSMDSR